MKFNKTSKIIAISLGLAFVLVALIVIYSYFSNSALALGVKSIIPYRIVGSSMISELEKYQVSVIAKNMDENADINKALDRLIRTKLIKSYLDSIDLTLPSDAIADEYVFLTKGKEDEHKRMLKDYFGSSDRLFVKYVVEPQAWEAYARIQFNSDTALHNNEYELAKEVLSKAKDGEDFDSLAKQFSDDLYTGQFGGDLGFYSHGQLLPELEKEIAIMQFGRVSDKIFVSREGYHVVYPVETSIMDGVKLWHVQHILIKVDGFDDWFASKTKDIGVWSMLK
jgi:hypothetical protein